MSAAPSTVPLEPAQHDPSAWPRKLNLGCGFNHLDGFVNVDMHPEHGPDLVADVRRLHFLPAGYYDEIVASDLLEHLPRAQSQPVLAHWNRLLREGGKITVRVPSVTGIAALMNNPHHRNAAKHEEFMHFLFGSQAYDGDWHLTSFTDLLLQHYLEVAGFEVRKMKAPDLWLLDAVAVKRRDVDGPPVITAHDLRGECGDLEFVRRCYQEILRRPVDSVGEHNWVNALASGTLLRQGVVDELLGSAEFLQRFRK